MKMKDKFLFNRHLMNKIITEAFFTKIYIDGINKLNEEFKKSEYYKGENIKKEFDEFFNAKIEKEKINYENSNNEE